MTYGADRTKPKEGTTMKATPLRVAVTLNMTAADAHVLRALADHAGLSPDDYVRVLIRERLRRIGAAVLPERDGPIRIGSLRLGKIPSAYVQVVVDSDLADVKLPAAIWEQTKRRADPKRQRVPTRASKQEEGTVVQIASRRKERK